MKLAVSNIAWETADLLSILAILEQHGVAGVEVAPTKLWPDWNGATPAAAKEHRLMLEDHGLRVPALQSLLFGRPDLRVFGTDDARSAVIAHLALCAEIAAALGAGTMVFGSPGNRDRGALTVDEADAIAARFFSEAARVCHDHGVVLGLEPNPGAYKCNYITRWREAACMVRTVDHPGLRLHLDTACIHLGGDDPVDAIWGAADIASHFHVSEPFLAPVDGQAFDHRRVGEALASSPYNAWISIEMKATATPVASVEESVLNVLRWYA